MSNDFLKNALEANMQDIGQDQPFAIDLLDDDLDAVGGGRVCGVMKVDCSGTYTVNKEVDG